MAGKQLIVMLLISLLIISLVSAQSLWDERRKERQAQDEALGALGGLEDACEDLRSMKDRISCYVKEGTEATESEECRSESKHRKADCKQWHNTVRQCLSRNTQEGFDLCVRGNLGLKSSIDKDLTACADDKQCITDLKQKYYKLIKARFYNLPYKARQYHKDDYLSDEELIDFLVVVEVNIELFNSVRNAQEKRPFLIQMQSAWDDLINKVEAAQ